MTNNEVLVTFFTIVYGILLTDLFLSFHKLIRDKKKVTWHWLSILTTWYLFLIILKNWWDLYISIEISNIYFFIAYGHLMLLLFLLISNVLPDFVDEKGVDLKKYYFDNHRYFWGLMLCVFVVTLGIRFFKHYDKLTGGDIINVMLQSSIFIVIVLLLTISKKYWIHASLLILLVIETLFEIIMKGYS